MRPLCLVLSLFLALGTGGVATAQNRTDTYSFRHAGALTECTVERRNGRTYRVITRVFGLGSSSTVENPDEATWQDSGCASHISQQRSFPSRERLQATARPASFDDLMFQLRERQCDARLPEACRWLEAHYAAVCQGDTGSDAGVEACARMQSFRARAAIIEEGR